jgi:hypothetical protein
MRYNPHFTLLTHHIRPAVVSFQPYGFISFAGVQQYTVMAGDTLATIASMHSTTIEAILQQNPSIINSDVIFPGQSVVIPSG